MGIYDDLEPGAKKLADTLIDTRKMEKELAAVVAKAGEGAADVVVGAMATAKAAGVTEQAAKGAAGGAGGGGTDEDLATAARITVLNDQKTELATAYAAAVGNNQLADLIGLKNRITQTNQELSTLEAAQALAKVANAK
jgi:hypothetical protein